MPSQRRLDLPLGSQHVIQQGSSRQASCLREQYCRRYLSHLGQAALVCGCRIHADVLTANPAHLLMKSEVTSAFARTMRSLFRRYVGNFIGDLSAQRYAFAGSLLSSSA